MSELIESLPDGATEAAIVFVVSLVLGVVVDQILFWYLRSRSSRRCSPTLLQLAEGVHGLPTIVGLLFGTHLALLRVELRPGIENTTETALEVLAIVVGTAFAARILGRMVNAYTSREGTALPSSSIFVNLARGVVWAIGALIILAALDISIAPLITALGVGGLAVGLALQPTLENLFAGVQVLMSRQVEPGDFVRLETGEEGWVQDVTWRNTTIKMLSNDVIIVPNATLGKSRVTNFSTMDEQHSVIVPLGVAYGSDLEHVERVTRETAAAIQRDVEGAVPDFEPIVRFNAFGDSAMELRAVLRVEQYADRFEVQHQFIKRLYARYDAEGISVPFPQRVVHMAAAD